MNPYANPTMLRVGMTGALDGRRYRVAGRVVMGMEEAGETYYWNEFNLVDDAGNSITLVFEETENGPEWKLFTLFEPVRPMSVAEAARMQVGDTVNLDGTPTPITLVDESRVYHTDGTAPAGVEVGDIAHYFNADAGDRMVVASWTGDEIEFYHGVDLPAKLVVASFGLASPVVSGLAVDGGTEEPGLPVALIVKLLGVAVVAGIAIAGYVWWRKPAAAPKKPVWRAASLRATASGTLAGQSYTITGHVVVEVKKVSGNSFWHEYRLRDGAGDSALLICGLTGNPHDWHLFHAVTPALTPKQAGGKHIGDAVELDGYNMRVLDLFEASGTFGILARAGDEFALVRWTETAIEFYHGQRLTEKEVLRAFSPAKR